MRRAVSARHTTELEALLVDDRFDGDVYRAEPMARHTMYRIGGPARFYVQTASVGALVRLVEVCERTGVPWVVVGRGSNLLVADEGFPGVVVTLGRDFRTCRFDEEAGRFCVEESFRIHGGYGYSKEYEIERLYRDAPLLLIGEGTSEIQRMVIGKKLLQRHKI